MPHDLVAEFTSVLQDASEVGGNHHLTLLMPLVQDIQSHQGSELDDAMDRLHVLLSDKQLALGGDSSIQFINVLSEAHFHVLATRSGVDLRKIPETNTQKTPDFQLRSDGNIYFEVKTPSIVTGKFALENHIEESLSGRLDQEQQIADGQRIAFFTQEIAPYGDIPWENRLTGVIEILSDKIGNNLKRKQFAYGPTYLVCSLLLLPPYGRTDCALRPYYRSSLNPENYVSGQLWMTAFSKKGMLILSEPEFEGKPTVEGTSEQVGILADSNFDFVEGIIFVIYEPDGSARMACLVRTTDDLIEPLLPLIGNRWNDQFDSNGYEISALSKSSNASS